MKAFVTALVQLLHEHAIDYAIGGSVASSYYGEARTTQDIDLSIMCDQNAVAPLVTGVEALGWYIARESVQHAVAAGDTFSINDGFWKADFFVVKDDAFALEAFRRRRQGTLALAGQRVWFLSPEDIMLHKLRWMDGNPLDKHVRDIVAILGVWYTELDLAYLSRWVAEFGTGELWAGILDRFRREQNQ